MRLMTRLAGLMGFIALFAIATPAMAKTKTILALGDSLTAGYGLTPEEAFPERLQAALRAKGHDVRITNAGVSGDTTAGGRARLETLLANNRFDYAIVALGANDMLRRLPADQMKSNLTAIVAALKAKKTKILLVGIEPPPGPAFLFMGAYTDIFEDVADDQDVEEFYPSFLKGVEGDPDLNLADGIHPNAAGINIMVKKILSDVEDLIED